MHTSGMIFTVVPMLQYYKYKKSQKACTMRGMMNSSCLLSPESSSEPSFRLFYVSYASCSHSHSDSEQLARRHPHSGGKHWQRAGKDIKDEKSTSCWMERASTYLAEPEGNSRSSSWPARPWGSIFITSASTTYLGPW